jgi:Domain of unknown function (DUF4262)
LLDEEREFLLQIRSKICDDVGRDGFSRIGFGPFPNVRGRGRPYNVVYSVGLSHTNASCADVIIFGPYHLPLLMNIVWDVARSMLLEGARYQAGSSQTVTVEGKVYPFPFFFAEVEKRYFHKYPKAAVDYYATTRFSLLQVVWPDTHGRWPWNPGFEEQFSGTQPLLFDTGRAPLP